MIVILLAAGAMLLSACGAKNANQQTQGPPPPVSVFVTKVVKTDAIYYDEFPGSVTALNQVDLRAQVSGFITGIYFKDGDRVKKGQKLYSIDQQQYEANYQQAQANVQVQETNLLKAQKDADRYHTLDQQDAIAKQQVDYADANLEAAKKQLDAAKASMRAVQTSVRYTTIEAPFDGTIGISAVKMGGAVTAGQTVLNTVSSDNPIAVDFSVDQHDLYRFTSMQQKGAKPKDSAFRIAFGTELYPYPGSIYLVDRAVDLQSGTIKTRLKFENPNNILKPGMSGVVKVLHDATAGSVIIPFKAITEQLGEFFVYVVNGDKVTQRKVLIGKQIGANVIIRDGLKEGEVIVTEGTQKLREGSSIKIDEGKAAAQPKT
jgi:membrane fusion protein (multidrug efflux system)